MKTFANACTCSFCGYQWEHGQSGSHDCACILRGRLDAAHVVLRALIWDYNHAWPNEDEKTRIHREGVLERLRKIAGEASPC